MKRPLGVSLIAGYAAVVAMLPLGASIKFFFDQSIPLWVALAQLMPAVLAFLFAVGLWYLRRWGLWIAIGYYGFELVYMTPEVLSLVRAPDPDYWLYIAIICWQFLFAAVILVYLLRPSTRGLFRDRAANPGGT